jgi:hypothetical protein
MYKKGVVAALTGATILAVSMLAAAETSTRPPTNLKKVGDHWTPWDPPAAGPDAYIINKGDTLWDLAQRWLGDPYLWPQIWDENRYILDSHWIYPGDPLVVPGKPTVVPEGELPVVDDSRVETPDPEEPSRAAAEPPPPMRIPMADPEDLYCTGWIVREPQEPALWIAGRDLERISVAEGDVVFLNHGRDQAVAPGAEFSIVRPAHLVHHPESGRVVGTLIRRLGKLRVMLAHDRSATAVITMSCEDIVDGDQVVPWEDIAAPTLSSIPEFDRYDPTPSGGPVGTVVAQRDDLSAFAAGHIIYTDLGSANGVVPGDVLTLYRDRAAGRGENWRGEHGPSYRPGDQSYWRQDTGYYWRGEERLRDDAQLYDGVDLPRMNLGQAVVLTVGPDTSTAKITRSVRESRVGDRVEVR